MTLELFPSLPGLTFPITRTNLGFAVVRQQSVSGARTQFAQRSRPIWQWTLSFEMLRDWGLRLGVPFSDQSSYSDTTLTGQETLRELQRLAGFFNATYGGALPFVYRDPSDGTVTNEPFGQGNGLAKAFQLVRAWGGFTEPVLAPLGVPTIFINGVATGAFTLSETGVVTFSVAPASGSQLTWSGDYGWRCRFDDDAIDFEGFMAGLWRINKLRFSAELLP